MFDKQAYENDFHRRVEGWKLDDINLIKELSLSKNPLSSKEDGEKVLKVYFSQFFEKNLVVHIDLRKSSFCSLDFFYWIPQLGMIRDSMSEMQKEDMKVLFCKHFGEGRTAAIKFSLENLQGSFNAIFSYFLKEDIPLNPEFAVLEIYLVTLYLTLQDIPHELNVSGVFSEVFNIYQR